MVQGENSKLSAMKHFFGYENLQVVGLKERFAGLQD